MLAQRVLGGEHGQLGYGLFVSPEREQHVGVVGSRPDPQLGEPVPLGLGMRPGNARQRGAAPQAERFAQSAFGAGKIPVSALGSCPRKQVLEGHGVQGAWVKTQQVTGTGADQHRARVTWLTVRVQDTTQASHVCIDAALGSSR